LARRICPPTFKTVAPPLFGRDYLSTVNVVITNEKVEKYYYNDNNINNNDK